MSCTLPDQIVIIFLFSGGHYQSEPSNENRALHIQALPDKLHSCEFTELHKPEKSIIKNRLRADSEENGDKELLRARRKRVKSGSAGADAVPQLRQRVPHIRRLVRSRKGHR